MIDDPVSKRHCRSNADQKVFKPSLVHHITLHSLCMCLCLSVKILTITFVAAVSQHPLSAYTPNTHIDPPYLLEPDNSLSSACNRPKQQQCIQTIHTLVCGPTTDEHMTLRISPKQKLSLYDDISPIRELDSQRVRTKRNV